MREGVPTLFVRRSMGCDSEFSHAPHLPCSSKNSMCLERTPKVWSRFGMFRVDHGSFWSRFGLGSGFIWGRFWGRLRAVFGPLRCPSSAASVSRWCRFGVGLLLTRGRFGVDSLQCRWSVGFLSLWCRCGVALVSLWCRLRVDFVSTWERFGVDSPWGRVGVGSVSRRCRFDVSLMSRFCLFGVALVSL